MSNAPSPSPPYSHLDEHRPRFAESGTGLALDSANPWASLFPLAKNWRVIGACYALWVLIILQGLWAVNRLGSGWIWATSFSSPLAHIGAFAFLAPLPWILPRRLPSPFP